MIQIKNKKMVRIFVLIMLDILSICLASFLSLAARFEFLISDIPSIYIANAITYLPVHIILTIALFFMFRLYQSLWKFAGINEALGLIFSCVISALVQYVAMGLLGLVMPRSFFLFETLLLMVFVLLSRFSYRMTRYMRKFYFPSKDPGEKIMVIGAGNAGRMIIRELVGSSNIYCQIACIIDDDPAKVGSYILGCPIVGDRERIPENVKKYGIDTIVLAIPSAGAKVRKEILDICQQTSCQLKSVPGLYQIISGEVHIADLQSIEIEDLLGRDPIYVNMDEIDSYISGKTVLVTGGGGSIGSELCRQLASRYPKRLIIFDIYENGLYDIQQELLRINPALDLVAVVGSVRDYARISGIIEEYRPQIVYHAAAHKHVPLMEHDPNEAVKNNVFGTYNTAEAAGRFAVEKFVLISTDKAVNPTSIMGATKRLCEMIIQCFDKCYKTEFVAVRFGNVLGSNGSVVPLFRNQIAKGGPVTVTHKDITRFFMTIPEAVSLVLQAGAYARGGEIFVLDMGEPIKIDDLARKLIQLSGYIPDVDIEIKYIGLRPGEKLYEEVLMNVEGLTETQNRSIKIGMPIEMNEDEFFSGLAELKEISLKVPEKVVEKVASMVSTYHPQVTANAFKGEQTTAP